MSPHGTSLLAFPPGALLRVEQIVGNSKKGVPALIPVSANTWWRWAKEGRIPPGRKLGPRTTVWSIEAVMAIGQPQGEQAQA
jgi:predicted DNA-binding transcriptional regulator AlpA